MIENITTDKNYLSDLMKELPSHCLLNKGVTGCGGTYVELHSTRNSIILVPTIDLARNKEEKGFLVVYGEISDNKIKDYINSSIKYKKIIGTYDCLKRLMNYNVLNYFLLIDEYHLLFNAYSFRNDAIQFVLKNYDKFNKYCFMTATPLDDNTILQEIKHLKIINVNWIKAVPIKLNLIDTYFTTKELLSILLDEKQTCNFHIFLNSLKTITEVVNKLKLNDYRVICSKRNTKIPNRASTKDPVKKYNFYTASAFEGCDIYDPIGKTIIICDTKISTTMLDISTLIIQICGRLRDSQFKDDITLILNTYKHRYAKITEDEFLINIEEQSKQGLYLEDKFKNADDEFKQILLKTFSQETHYPIYVNKYENELYYDGNLKNVDKNNFNVVNKIYKNTISVLKEYSENNIEVNIKTTEVKDIYTNIKSVLLNKEYTFSELKDLFIPIFKIYNLSFNSSMLKLYFPEFTKCRKTREGKKDTYYKFNI